MKAKDLKKIGIPNGAPLKAAAKTLGKAFNAHMLKDEVESRLQEIINDAESFINDPLWGDFATAMLNRQDAMGSFVPRTSPAPYRSWGDGLEEKALTQMEHACQLPVSTRGALMPDAHMGYGLPIGGVIATRNSVIPYAVGMDIACRMKLTVLDLPLSVLESQEDRLRNAVESETSFGVGAKFKHKRLHSVMDEDWSVSPVTERFKDKAWSQLGTSGSGNHFVEFGVLTFEKPSLGL